ncbi:MAG: acyl-ACP desaturase [Candidatus Saccharimonas sp.]
MTELSPSDKAPSRDILTPSNVKRIGRNTIHASGLITIGGEPDQITLLHELDPVVDRLIDEHVAARTVWMPHDFMPIDDEGRIITRRLSSDESPLLTPDVTASVIVNFLTEENLPGYHRVISENFSHEDAFRRWTNKWTAEEANHGYILHVFLDLTRAVSPEVVERLRVNQVEQGYEVEKDPLHTLVYVTFQELATRVSHRQTGAKSDNPILNEILKNVAADENHHMIFYRNLVAEAFNLAPNQTMQAIYDEIKDFEMPGANIEGFQRRALQIANADIYNLPRHIKEVIMPVLRYWNVFKRDDLTGFGAQARDDLALHLEKLQRQAASFTDKRESGQLGRVIDMMARRNPSDW